MSGSGCRKCGEYGHFARECPLNANGGNGGGLECLACGEYGHSSMNCPDNGQLTAHGYMAAGGDAVDSFQDDDPFGGPSNSFRGGASGGSRPCYNCGEEGHVSRECPNPRRSGGNAAGRAANGGGSNCYNCGEEGHVSRECPNPRSSGGNAAGRVANGGGSNCYNCGEAGHISRDCPNERRQTCRICQAEGHFAADCPSRESGEPNLDPAAQPRERYVPPELENGDEVFEELKTTHCGSGLHFEKHDDIPVKVTGEDLPDKANSFAEMNIRPILNENLIKCGYKRPTPIQRYAIPILMKQRDIMACAQTGSGKSCAFLLPILTNIMADPDISGPSCPAKPEALILAPTRELALQIGKESHAYGQGSIVKTRIIYGGTLTSSQKKQVTDGCNVLAATPGRLKQFLREKVISLENTRFFILDEADRMLDMGFMADVREIVAQMPNKEGRVSGMFSATFPQSIQELAKEFLNTNYIFVSIGAVGGANTDVQQEFLQLERKEKKSKLIEILKEVNITEKDKVLIFTGSKNGTDFLAGSLVSSNFSTTSIHGARFQSQRESALNEFRCGLRQILVATSVAARGLDVPNVALVINYDLPQESDEYIHRIGRTGRVGNTGKSISFYDPEYDSALLPALKRILKDAGQPVPDWMEISEAAYAECDYGIDLRDGLEERLELLSCGDNEDW